MRGRPTAYCATLRRSKTASRCRGSRGRGPRRISDRSTGSGRCSKCSWTALGLLISYQSYKLLHVFSLGLTALTILDGLVLVLAWHEYRFTLRTKSPAPASSSLD